MKVKKINSLIDPEKTMHIMCRQDNEDFTRIDVVDEEQYLQLAVLKMYKGKTFKPHKHIFKNVPETSIAQESWFVSRGKVKAIFYDLDDNIIDTPILNIINSFYYPNVSVLYSIPLLYILNSS